MTDKEIRQRQRSRAKVMGVLLIALVVLIYGISIAKMVVQLGQSLDMSVIAEGVETSMQADTLLSFGCHLAQGYLYAKPMTPDDLHLWLENNGNTKTEAPT